MSIEPRTLSPRAQRALSVVLGVYVCVCVLQSWPPPDAPPGGPPRMAIRNVVKPLQPLLGTLGMVQEWHMFVRPGPRNLNRQLTATITFEDGSTEDWALPHPAEVPPLQRYRLGGRYHDFKYFFFQPENAPLWPDLARWLARRYNQPGQVPVQVDLYELVSYVGSPPDRGPLPDAYIMQPKRKTWHYVYTVLPADLP